MLPQPFRLRQRRAFPLIYQHGHRLSSPRLVLHWDTLSQDHPQPSQWAVVVSKKVSRHAVVRNRIKRQIRAALTILLNRLAPGYWGIIVARASSVQSDWHDIHSDLILLFRSGGLLLSEQELGL